MIDKTEIGKMVFFRGLMENVYPVIVGENIPKEVLINGKRPLGYRLEFSPANYKRYKNIFNSLDDLAREVIGKVQPDLKVD